MFVDVNTTQEGWVGRWGGVFLPYMHVVSFLSVTPSKSNQHPRQEGQTEDARLSSRSSIQRRDGTCVHRVEREPTSCVRNTAPSVPFFFFCACLASYSTRHGTARVWLRVVSWPSCAKQVSSTCAPMYSLSCLFVYCVERGEGVSAVLLTPSADNPLPKTCIT